MLAVLPVFISSLTVVSLAGELVLPQRPGLVPLVWVLSAGLVFVRPAEAAVAWLLGARRPTPAQERRLVPAWLALCRRGGGPQRPGGLRGGGAQPPLAAPARAPAGGGAHPPPPTARRGS